MVAAVALGALPLLIYLPPVQNWLVRQASAIASEQTGLDIQIEQVHLGFPLDLCADGILVKQEGDTVASIGRAVVDVSMLPLLAGDVKVDALEVLSAQVNTLDLISDVQVKGTLGKMLVNPSDIHLALGRISLGAAALHDADITVLLSDTAAVDTTDTPPAFSRIDIESIAIHNSQVSVHLPGDSMLIGVGGALLQASGGSINLTDSRYEVGQFVWEKGNFMFDLPFEPRQPASLLDYSHINLTGIDWTIDSLLYADPLIKLHIRQAAMKEACGLHVAQLQGPVVVDDKGIRLSALTLRTPYSYIYTTADVDFSVADSISPGQMDVTLDAQVGKQDIAFFYNGFDLHQLPEWPLSLKGKVQGNTRHATFLVSQLSWPTVVQAEGSGTLDNLTDTNRLKAQLNMDLQTYNLLPLLKALDVPSTITIPNGLALDGTVEADGPRYTADLTLRDGTGTAKVKGSFDQRRMAYEAEGSINGLNLQHFLPSLGLSTLTSQFTASGEGTDFRNPGAAWLDADISIAQVGYGQYLLNDLSILAHLKDGLATADITACDTLVEGSASMNIHLANDLQGEVSANISHLNLYALGLSANPLTVGMSADFDIKSDLSKTHRLSGLIDHIYLRDSVKSHQPEKVGLLLNLREDTTYVRAQSGSLIIKLDASGHYEPLVASLSALSDTIASQVKRHVIDQTAVKQMLPNARLYISSGQNNPAADILKAAANTEFKEMLVNITTSPVEGINGEAQILSLNADSTRIDSIFITLKDKPNHGLTFQGRVANNRRNPQFVFTAMADGLLQEHGLTLGVRFFDDKNRLGLRLGSKVEMEDNGLRFHLLPARPTIGYREFALNDDNYLFLDNNSRLQAKVQLRAEDGAGMNIYSEEQAPTLLQDLTVSINHFDLERLTSALPYVPHITGTMNGDYHLTMDEKKQISVASDMQVKQLTYEGSPMGNLSAEFVYLQREDDTHAVEGLLAQDNNEILAFSGNYRNKKVTAGHEQVDGTLTLTKTPLGLINGFIPDRIIGLEGFAEGELSVKGSLSKPDVNGEVMLDAASLISEPYGVRMRFDNDPVRIQKSKLLLENFTMYGYNNNPLNIMGDIDFHDLDHMSMDLRMRATNYQLINAKQTANSIAFGKAFVNFYAVMRGPMDQLRMRGRLDLLGTTDLTYLLLDSPLSTDNQLDELVKFTDFQDSTQTVVQRPAPSGLDMDLRISIDQGAHVKCGLNADQSNYVDIFGGGDLRMVYNNANDLRLTGRYTLTSGQMKYSLPVIPLKTFTIRDGSYVEFTGDAMNPTLSITATERTTATVGNEGEQARSVVFDCGVAITQTLNNMGLKFIIEAPEDYSINTELATMSTEQRSKLAVTMLTTGMYLADGNTSGFSMNAALSSFLESEINNITGSALKSVDLSVGVDNTTDASGQSHTNYSFKFAKRFWNNRLKVQIGGKVSSGSDDMQNGQQQSFFDNVSMEYRLSPTSNQYIKLFYEQNSYDWLEGYTGKYGGGYIWRKKLDHWWQFFMPSSHMSTTSRQTTANSQRQPAANSQQPAANSQSTATNDSIR